MEKYKQNQLLNATRNGFTPTVIKILTDNGEQKIDDERFIESLVDCAISINAYKTLAAFVKNHVVGAVTAVFNAIRANKPDCVDAVLDYADVNEIHAIEYIAAESYNSVSNEMRAFFESSELDLHQHGIIF